MRASGSDEKTNIAPPILFSLEEALEYIKEDEYVEVTPKSMRLRKIYLDENERKRRSQNHRINKKPPEGGFFYLFSSSNKFEYYFLSLRDSTCH